MKMQNSVVSKSDLIATRKRGLLYIFLLFLFLVAVIVIVYSVIGKQLSYKREVEQYAELFDMQNRVTSELSSVGADLFYYAQSDLALATLTSQDKTAKDYLASLMYKISELQNRYDQIRLFDELGNEIIRIDQEEDFSLRQIPDTELQNKGERYYFKEALNLLPGQIYASPFDLNIERGKIEYPIKPMIRFAMPIFSEQGKLLGAAAINYKGEKILRLLTELNVHQGDQIFLLNNEGYYLKGTDPQKEWLFMFPEKKQFRFADEYSEVWKEMQGHDNGLVETANGEYYFSSFKLTPISSLFMVNAERVFLVMHVPKIIINVEKQMLVKGLLIGFLLLVPILFFLGWSLAKSQIEQARLFQKLKFDAMHDALTGLYNRKAIIDFLDKYISIHLRRNSPLAVGFIDVNDLKIMNDQYGHDAGDELIQGVASAIKISIRKSDFAARLGGDEFLIVFVDCDKDAAQYILRRIQARFASLGRIKTNKDWSLSFGCTELLGSEDSSDKMIERADNAMYEQKVWQKNLPARHA